ncbi:MAG: hypothetical protein ACYCVN_01045 [Acidimicrobiales bacterium]
MTVIDEWTSGPGRNGIGHRPGVAGDGQSSGRGNRFLGPRRRPLLAVGSVLLVFTSIAVFAAAYSSAGRQTAVLIVTSTVQRGAPFTAGMLGEASAAVSGGAEPIPATEASMLSGKRAAVTLPAGSLLTSEDVSSSPAIPTGDAVVGLALKAGQLPASGVEAGDAVMIVETGAPGAPTAAPPVAVSGAGATAGGGVPFTTGTLVPRAFIFDVAAPSPADSSSISQLVSVEVPATEAAAVSAVAAADEVALVLLPPMPAGGKP